MQNISTKRVNCLTAHVYRKCLPFIYLKCMNNWRLYTMGIRFKLSISENWRISQSWKEHQSIRQMLLALENTT